MRRWLALLLLVLITFSLPSLAEAQTPVVLESALIQLWPEFDKVEMLVIAQLSLGGETTYPLDLDFRLPASGMIHTVAWGEAQNAVSDQGVSYQTRQDGDWQVITIEEIGGAAVRIEYYDTLIMSGSDRDYRYDWLGDFPTGSLQVIFQQPVDATDVQIDPPPAGTSSDSNGLLYHRIEFPSLASGQAVSVTVEYKKNTSRLSMSLPVVQPEEPLGGTAEGQVSFAKSLPWLVGGAGLLLIGVGLAFGLSYWRGTSGGGKERKRHSSKRPARSRRGVILNCPECGHRLEPGDHFCRACGTSLAEDE